MCNFQYFDNNREKVDSADLKNRIDDTLDFSYKKLNENNETIYTFLFNEFKNLQTGFEYPFELLIDNLKYTGTFTGEKTDS